MKYIIVKGNNNSGRLATINEICRRLAPEKIVRVSIDESGKLSLYNVYDAGNMQDKTYIMHTRGKKVLVVGGIPTKQHIRISRVVSNVRAMGIDIDLAIVPVDIDEKLKSFSAGGEQQQKNAINFMPSNKLNITDEWRKRIAYLTGITSYYL